MKQDKTSTFKKKKKKGQKMQYFVLYVYCVYVHKYTYVYMKTDNKKMFFLLFFLIQLSNVFTNIMIIFLSWTLLIFLICFLQHYPESVRDSSRGNFIGCIEQWNRWPIVPEEFGVAFFRNTCNDPMIPCTALPASAYF